MTRGPKHLLLLMAMALPFGAIDAAGAATQPAGQTESATAIGIADAFLAKLAAGDYTGAQAMFDETAGKSLSPEKLGEVWTALPRQFGALGTRGAARLTAQDGHRLVFYRHEFANAPLDVLVAVDARGKISGFRILPVMAPAAPPSPAADAAFSERALRIGDMTADSQ